MKGYYLGPLERNTAAYRRYDLPLETDSVTIVFDFIVSMFSVEHLNLYGTLSQIYTFILCVLFCLLQEIGDWKGSSPTFMIENRHRIKPGPFWAKKNEGIREGYDERGDDDNSQFLWTMRSVGKPRKNPSDGVTHQTHRLIVTFNRFMKNALLTFEQGGAPAGAAAGFRRIKILAHENCKSGAKNPNKLGLERKMEIRMMHKAYLKFYDADHCWRREVPKIGVTLIETESWREAKPDCF